MRNIGFRAISINVPDMEGQWVTTDEVGFVNFFYALKEGDLDEKTLGEKTGLKDKNGKEIYEGDIARVKQTAWGFVEHLIKISWNEEEAKFTNIVIAKNGEDKHNTPDVGEGWSMNVIADWVEVIGNVYENPELLKV